MAHSQHTNDTSPDCDALLALIPAYVIGAADPEDIRFVERYLQDCPEAAAELRAYTDLQDAMLFAAPLVEPPASLAAELQRRIHADQDQPQRMEPVAETTPARPAPVPSSGTPYLTPSTTRHIVPRTAPSQRTRLTATIAVVLTLLLISNLFWMAQNTRMEQEMQAAQNMRHERNSAIAALSAGDTRIVSLHDPTHTSGSITSSMTGAVIWSSQKQMAMISVANLPKTAPEQEYQLWFMDDDNDEKISMGTFRVQDDGMGMMVFELHKPIEDFEAFGITLEPAGGSPKPTTPPLLIGTRANPPD